MTSSPQLPPIVLIADDDDDLREVIVEMLRDELPYTLVEARDGLQALALMHANAVAVAILDHRMPELLGSDVVLRARAEGIDIPFILVSAAPDVEQLATEVEATSFLRKPFSFSELIAQVKQGIATGSRQR